MKENRLEKMLEIYKEIKENSFIIGTIDKDFFFEFCDCLIEKIKELKSNSDDKDDIMEDMRKQMVYMGDKKGIYEYYCPFESFIELVRSEYCENKECADCIKKWTEGIGGRRFK